MKYDDNFKQNLWFELTINLNNVGLLLLEEQENKCVGIVMHNLEKKQCRIKVIPLLSSSQ